jgi:hypothetical protein
VVRVGDRLDDGESESVIAGSGLCPKLVEGLKDACELSGRDERTALAGMSGPVLVTQSTACCRRRQPEL